MEFPFQIDGGTYISVTIRWSQKLLYRDGQFTLSIPYSFPVYVTPVGKKISKKEKIQFKVNCGPQAEVSCKAISHPLKVKLIMHSTDLYFVFDEVI